MLANEVLASDMLLLTQPVKATIALFVVVDPLGNVPIFISLTKNMNETQRKSTFRTATITGLMLLLAFALAGQQILSYSGYLSIASWSRAAFFC